MGGEAEAPRRLELAVLVDFDETAAEQNVAELLLNRYGAAEWEKLRERFRQGDLTLQAYQEAAFRRVQATPEEMGQYAAKHGNLRAGFLDLLSYCTAHAIHLAIVTYGLDFYVRAVLERYGIEGSAPAFSVETRTGTAGLEFLYRYAKPGCVGWGNCKCRVLEGFRERVDRIIYVGDGHSDFCPASKSDMVFARGPLVGHCIQQGIDFQPFEDFAPVLAAVRSEAAVGR